MTLENTVFDIVKNAIGEHLNKQLVESYRSPLDPFLNAAIARNAPAITALYENAVAEAIGKADLRPALVEAFNHKLARLLVSRFEGEIEKRANEMRSDPTFRAKVTLAIEAAVKEERT
jgi:hypothetical protein